MENWKLALLLLAFLVVPLVATILYQTHCESDGGELRWRFTSNGYAYVCEER